MAHTLVSLEKLGKSDLRRLVIDYKNKFDTVLNNINYWIWKISLQKLSQV